MFKQTGDGFPASLKDDRRHGEDLTMDQVEQVILRSVCLDGFKLGVEVGRRLAEKKAAKDNKANKDSADAAVDCEQVFTQNYNSSLMKKRQQLVLQ